MTDGMMAAYERWVDVQESSRENDFHGYVASVASARYVTRKVLRIINEQAKLKGVDPLQHQALLQIYAHDDVGIRINDLASLLDVAAALASRVSRQLEVRGFVLRENSADDRRVTLLKTTRSGVELLATIDNAVHIHVAYFQGQLTDQDRAAALAIYAFYVGLDPESRIAQEIRKELATNRP